MDKIFIVFSFLNDFQRAQRDSREKLQTKDSRTHERLVSFSSKLNNRSYGRVVNSNQRNSGRSESSILYQVQLDLCIHTMIFIKFSSTQGSEEYSLDLQQTETNLKTKIVRYQAKIIKTKIITSLRYSSYSINLQSILQASDNWCAMVGMKKDLNISLPAKAYDSAD